MGTNYHVVKGAVGNPFGLEQTVTTGIVSAKERFGINSAIFSQTGGSVGIGFAIPINIAKDVLPQLRERGTVVRGCLGVAVGPVSADVQRELGLPARAGALVAEVVPRSPAVSAGLARGDVVTVFQDAPIQSPNELTRRVGGTPPGTQVALKLVRPGALQPAAERLSTHFPNGAVP